jgi:chromatin remodeling complex protein RSC6
MPSKSKVSKKKTKTTRASTRKPRTKKVAKVAKVSPVVEAVAPVVEAVAPVVEAVAPVVEVVAPVVEVVAPVVADKVAVEEQVVKAIAKTLAEDEDVKIDLEFNNTINSMKTLIVDARGVLSSYKALHKRVNKRLKALNKKPRGGKRKGGNQKTNPSGFNKPTKITDALAKFLNVEKGSCLPRTDVTRRINAYIKEHNLQGMTRTDKNGIDKNDNRYINTTLPKSDKRYKHATLLKKLLVPTTDLSYFNLQTFLSPHFIKEPKKVIA